MEWIYAFLCILYSNISFLLENKQGSRKLRYRVGKIKSCVRHGLGYGLMKANEIRNEFIINLRNVIIGTIGILLFSCTTKPSITGCYTKVKENDRGTVWNVFQKGLVDTIYFGERNCRFDYFGIPMGGEYKIDGNYVYIAVGGELGTLSMEIIDSHTLEGEGWISGTFKKE